jgi:hypothetical protein
VALPPGSRQAGDESSAKRFSRRGEDDPRKMGKIPRFGSAIYNFFDPIPSGLIFLEFNIVPMRPTGRAGAALAPQQQFSKPARCRSASTPLASAVPGPGPLLSCAGSTEVENRSAYQARLYGARWCEDAHLVMQNCPFV